MSETAPKPPRAALFVSFVRPIEIDSVLYGCVRRGHLREIEEERRGLGMTIRLSRSEYGETETNVFVPWANVAQVTWT